jgi:lipopolysaccharide export system permease protein
MRPPRILSFYIGREVLQYTLLGLGAITMVVLTRNLVYALDELIGAGFVLSDLLTIVRLLVAMLAIYALPISFLFGVMLAVGRMQADAELSAMRACGVSLLGITLPVFLLGLCASALTFYLMIEVEPAAQRGFRSAITSMLARGAAVEPGEFRTIGERLIYVEGRNEGGELSGVVISDRSNPERPLMIFAERGGMNVDASHSELELRLENGSLHLERPNDPSARYERMSFERFEYTIQLAGSLTSMPGVVPRARELSFADLRSVSAEVEAGTVGPTEEQQPENYIVHLHRRFAVPLAPALFALVGVPLGMSFKRGARAWGVLLSAGLGFLYFALRSLTEYLALEGHAPLTVAMWTPNAVYALLAGILLWRARRPGT